MKSMLKRTTTREIKSSFGRYFAILAIVALGVGFFAGLKMTKPFMMKTVGDFLQEKNFYDLHLMSTIGYDEDDVAAFADQEQVEYAEGVYSFDALYSGIGENEVVLKTMSLPENVNGILLMEGRMAEADNECVVDAKMSDVEIGDTISLADTNDEDTMEVFTCGEFTVVGKVSSSLYINFERGTTSIGNGKISGFVYVEPEIFDCDYFTDVYVCFNQELELYSDEYNDFIDEKKTAWEDVCQERTELRYNKLHEDIVNEVTDEISDEVHEQALAEADAEAENQAQEYVDAQMSQSMLVDAAYVEELRSQMYQEALEEAKKDAEAQALEEADKEIEKQASEYADDTLGELEDVDYYILGRNTNIGYACFESDADIVNEIAKVFPVFFILVAALVCMTTMNRMVEEQRTQIGVLKALGYSETAIMGKFMFYSGSAALLGCIIGYAAGTYAFPQVIWTAYHMMYIKLDLKYIFSAELAVISLVVALLCSMGTTWLSCRYELSETASNLMRPKSPKAGKRVLLERIPFIWKRLKFLHKVSVRNIFRYKKRFFMMIIGISGCTALLLTGLGINDSISGFAEKQYEEIQVADGSITLKDNMDSSVSNSLTDTLDKLAADYDFVSETSWDLVISKSIKTINLVVMEKPENIGYYMDFHSDDNQSIAYPGENEAVINNAIADLYDISVGDEVTIRDSDMNEICVTVSGIFANHVYNYIYISPETYEQQMGKTPEYNTVYIDYNSDVDVHEAAAEIMKDKHVTATTLNKDTEERLTKMMSSLDYVVLLVIICAAALAFIVLYNLTNINITERIREIATIKVLGFFKNETASYVFRENRVLTAIGIVIGLVLGVFLHRFVMAQIHVDMVSFDSYIAPISYVYSIIMTFIFNFLVNRVMAVKLEKINMAESLKSVD
jgi:putative ABC transport system permease protein